MDLQSIRNMVKSVTDYAPELQSYNNQLDSLINEAYLRLWSHRRWVFTTQLMSMRVHPDMTPEREANGASLPEASYSDGQRLITFSEALRYTSLYREAYEGNVITLEGRDYTIVEVISPTSISVSEPIRVVDGSSSVTGYLDWTIKCKQYTLPEDCVEILGITHVDAPSYSLRAPRTRIPCVLPSQLDSYPTLENTTSNYAEYYVPRPPVHVPPGEKLSVDFTASEGASDGNLEQLSFYELCWSFVTPTKERGPLSEPVIVQVPENKQAPTQKYNATVKFLTWDDKEMASLNTTYTAGPGTLRPLEGMRKELWYNQNFNPATGERLGLPKWRQVRTGHQPGDPTYLKGQDLPLLTADTEATATILWTNSFAPGTAAYKEWDGQHFRIQFYPRLDAWTQFFEFTSTGVTIPPRNRDYIYSVDVRYLKKPNLLAAKTDTPELPYEMHQLIVWSVLEDVYNKSGNVQLASVYANKYERALKDIGSRYLELVDSTAVRGSFASGRPTPFLNGPLRKV